MSPSTICRNVVSSNPFSSDTSKEVRNMMEARQNFQKMVIEKAIAKAKKIMEGHPETKFTMEEQMQFHSSAYELIVESMEGSNWLYERFKKTMEESIVSIVLPSLVGKNDDSLLRALIPIWSNYKLMARWLCKFFEYLDRCFLPQNKFSLDDTSKNCFQDLVFRELYPRCGVAAITMIRQERKGLHIDRDLLKNVLLLFMEIYDNSVSYYEDFERELLEETAAYYCQLAEQWLLCYSTEDYIQKVYWCLNQEKERASYYFPSSAEKLLKVARYYLLDKTADKLIEKQKGENCGLVTDFQDMLSKCAGMKI
ncbi:hypothetical protein JCGZ_23336 [Jatropha curcas]|uniref:Cullin N-terminal domain-containing protein n=1 Tax=Jatropha curcas TaxID=180498 RepID=A0A067JKZ8_JATCU|nr:cullin-1 [Jatropha curcas]KDP23503.1 hypothetical protein JCGZ_23336 [Jatropha curcas]